MKNNRFKFILAISLAGIFLITSGQNCGGPSEDKGPSKLTPVNLTYWRVKEDSSSFSDLISGFQQIYPHVSITYKQLRPEVYEEELLNAWARDKGPDLFSIPSTWLGKYQDMILPIPLGAEIQMKREVIVGTFKKAVRVETKIERIYNLMELKKAFVDIVPEEILIDGNIYGLPMAMDILALYYNREMLNNAGIVHPPATWPEFIEDVRVLTFQDREGNFIQAGASLGGAENTRYGVDILSLLMLQNETPMVEGGNAAFNRPAPSIPGEAPYFPGVAALEFYTDFANPLKEIYTWNEDMPDSLDAFTGARCAFFFGYSSDLALIRALGPKLAFDITPVPQISGSLKKVNFANYWLETVSKKTAHPHEAWAFLNYISRAQNAKSFLDKVGYPTAHRDLISQQLKNIELAPFTEGVLTAKTWYHGKNYTLVEEAFKEMIKDVLLGRKETIKEAVDWCVQKVNLTY